MIIVRIWGGLGNQLFQYAMARSLALRKNDVLKLDIGYFLNQSQWQNELIKFGIDNKIAATSDEVSAIRGSDGIIQRNIRKSVLRSAFYPHYYKETTPTIFDENVNNYQSSIYLDGYWQNHKYFQDYSEAIIQELTPTIELSSTVRNYVSLLSQEQSIALHVRRGDYVTDAKIKSVHGVCDMEYYERAVSYMESRIEDPCFYVFSDDIKWCKQKFPFVKKIHFVDDVGLALEELFIMSCCKHNVIANSTFSWWGAFLNKNPEKQVVAPLKWFNDGRETDIVPHSWIKL